MRLLASDSQLKAITVNDGPEIKRSKDATFHVDDVTGRSIAKSSEFAVVGTNFRTARGFVCQSCGRINVFRERCGKCGSTDLTPER